MRPARPVRVVTPRVRAGSAAYPGAALLSVAGADCGLAGMVRYVGPENPSEQVRLHWPEAVFGSGRVQAWVRGSEGSEKICSGGPCSRMIP